MNWPNESTRTGRTALLLGLAAGLLACGPSGKGPGGGPVKDGGLSEIDSGFPTDSGGSPFMGYDGGKAPAGAVGSTCTPGQSEECLSGICLSNNRCSQTCAADSDCPPTWTCSPVDGGPSVCQCAINPAGLECNGRDNNCDGIIDEGTNLCPDPEVCTTTATTDGGPITGASCTCPAADQCGSTCLDTQTDPLNCGTCNHACAIGEVCVTGGCVCAPPLSVCSGACIDETADPNNCGGCDMKCPASQDCAGSQCVVADLEWARWPMLDAPALSVIAGTSHPVQVQDMTTGLIWEQLGMGDFTMQPPANYAAGQAHCAMYGGAWRLPTRIELLSITDFSVPSPGPALDTAAFPDPEENENGDEWTQTVDATNSSDQWIISFQEGAVGPASQNIPSPWARCVQ